jgi:hypothetical protein
MRRALPLFALLAATQAFAQKEEVFGSGKPVVYREETMDKRFAKSKVAKLLKEGTDDPACVELLSGLLMALAEIGPVLHKKDENFTLDPTLQNAIATQLSTPNFPAMAYLVSMVRRVLIDKRLPDEWLETAKAINAKAKIIDMAKLKQLNDGVAFADSADFTIPLLKNRYIIEVVNANSAVTTDVAGEFRDAYLDRDVAWGGAFLIDAGLNAPKGKKKITPGEAAELAAIHEWQPPHPRKTTLDFMSKNSKPPPPIRIIVKLAAKQFADLEKLHRGQRVLVKGRFWEMNKTFTELEVRDAWLFEDRDFSAGVMLGSPADVAQCPAAINELTGLAPQQPGGFKH